MSGVQEIESNGRRVKKCQHGWNKSRLLVTINFELCATDWKLYESFTNFKSLLLNACKDFLAAKVP